MSLVPCPGCLSAIASYPVLPPQDTETRLTKDAEETGQYLWDLTRALSTMPYKVECESVGIHIGVGIDVDVGFLVEIDRDGPDSTPVDLDASLADKSRGSTSELRFAVWRVARRSGVLV